MKIGIVGSGNVGRSLGVLWAEHGHEVFFGSRNVERAQSAAGYTRSAAFGSNAEAAGFGEVVLWTLRSVPAAEALGDAGLLDGKIVIDPNNAPLREDLRLGPREDVASLAERLALDVPQARIVKAFNTLPIEVLELSPTPLRDYAVARSFSPATTPRRSWSWRGSRKRSACSRSIAARSRARACSRGSPISWASWGRRWLKARTRPFRCTPCRPRKANDSADALPQSWDKRGPVSRTAKFAPCPVAVTCS